MDKVPTLTRKDIARAVAKKLNIKLPAADKIADAVLTSIRELLMTADPEIRLEVRDFGVFEVKLTKAKPRARNPKTGDNVFVPPRRKTHFKASKLLKSFLAAPMLDEEIALMEDEEREPNVYPMSVSTEDLIAR